MDAWRALRASSLFAVVAILFGTAIAAGQQNYAQKLGYPADAKLLILHADDLAVAHSVDEASFYALENGDVTSASVIVPAPWLTEVAAWFKQHPNADIGIHSALTSEWQYYRWRPVTPEKL